jgi:LacI family transcriptional regulator
VARGRGLEISELWWDGAKPLPRGLTRLDWIARQLHLMGPPVGVMAENDAVATDVLDAAQRAGLRVPEEVAVIGVDNDSVMAELGPVPLTSVDTARERVGYEAAALLDRLMDGAAAPRAPVLVAPAGVVIRQSTEMLAVSDPDILGAIRFIRENFRRPIGVADVAKHTFLSRRRLQDRFQETVGHSMNDEIVRRRLDLCKDLLTRTTHKIATIATLTGFLHVNRMIRTFNRKLGMTPGEYRQRYQLVFMPNKGGQRPG